jgi:hypothetical protein
MQVYLDKFLRVDLYSKVVLTAIALLLAAIAFRPITHPQTASAASNYSNYLYVEPGTTSIRKPDGSSQVEGKVIIDMRTGDIWGFPTLAPVPYPFDSVNSKPPVSSPVYLGKFDLAKMTTSQP